jgi:malonate decarboxylase alpha subunit
LAKTKLKRHNQKLARAASVLGASLHDKVVPADMAVRLLEAVIEPGDRVCLGALTTNECRA